MSTYKLAPNDLLVGRYRIIRFLAAGSMQEVYICHDVVLNRKAVLKTPKGTKDKRFRRGAEMGARMNHPNVATTFDYSDAGGMTFMVEEYIPGIDLAQRLENDFHFMDPALAAHVIHHIARALHEAHRVGICHRDLKPSNVMTSSSYSLRNIKLTDFGIAKLTEEQIGAELDLFREDASTLTSSDTLLGAIPYMAPECWDDWKSAGQPMDIWSLGCMGYQLLTGELPFGSGKPAIAKVVKAQAANKVSLNLPSWFGKHASTAKLEKELWGIIVSCMQIDPKVRPSAKEVVESCDLLCYAASTRKTGIVEQFPGSYAGGGKTNWGFILDDTSQESWFFHCTEFFGAVGAARGQRVSYCIYKGEPKPRLAPVLLLKPK